MRSTLDELISELNDLKALAASIDPVNAALVGHNDSVVQQYVSIRRRFDYAAFVVALYSSFEKFVENLITAYVRLEAGRLGYAALPDNLRDRHLKKTAEFLLRSRREEGRYVGLSELDVLRNLFECLRGDVPYKLNEALVVAHDANLRTSELETLFGAVGVKNICDLACRADSMVAWHCVTQGLEMPPQDGVKRTVLDERLKDIVERRNQVAHRGGSPLNFFGRADMDEAVAFIGSLATSIFGLIVGRYLETHHAATTGRIELSLRAGDGPFKGGTIVIVDNPAQKLFVGQPVFVLVESTGARWGRIQSLRVDNSDVLELAADAHAPNGVGVGLDFKFPRRSDAKLIALGADDDLIWSPLPPIATAG